MKKLFKHAAQSGQGLVEYALILTLVSIVAIVIVGATGTGVKGVYCKVVDGLNQNTGTCDTTPDDQSKDQPQDEPQDKPQDPPKDPPVTKNCETTGIGEGDLLYYEVYTSSDGGATWTYLNWQYWTSGAGKCSFPHQFHHK